MKPSNTRPGLRAITLAQAVRLMEETGPLLDGEEMTRAHHTQTGTQDRLLERARLLALRLQLDRDLDRLRLGAWVAGLLLVVLAYTFAGGLLARAFGQGPTINAALAFFSILAVPTLTLALWLLAVLWSLVSTTPGSTFSMGKWLMELAARVPWLHGPNATHLVRALHGVLQERRLGVWVFGAISHLLWAIALGLVLLTLLLLFAFQAYSLTWETTILSPDFFERFLRVTAWLPGLMGFPTPAAVPLNAAASAGASHTLAWWLVGCTVVYGLLPRLVALVACAWFVRSHRKALVLDTREPYFRKLVARFAAMEPSHVVDAEHAAPHAPAPRRRALKAGEQAERVLIGFELPAETAWPPQDLAPLVQQLHFVSGSMEDRSLVMARLAQAPAFNALVICNGASSPDRGTERFLRQLVGEAHACALLLSTPTDGHLPNPERWSKWLDGTGLPDVPCFQQSEDARRWLKAT